MYSLIGIWNRNNQGIKIGNPKYKRFFELLSLTELNFQTIDINTDIHQLDKYHSILIGESQAGLTDEEIECLNNWISMCYIF